MEKCARYAEEGYRILVIAHSPQMNQDTELPEVLTPCGLLLMTDIIRPEAQETLAYFDEQGVDLKVISGDDPVTVAAIARKAGLKNADYFVDATTLKTPGEMIQAVKKYSIFGRVTPKQKKQMVMAALVLILVAAVYLNWQCADIPATTTGGEVSAGTTEDGASEMAGEESLSQVNGETQQSGTTEETAESSGQKILGEATFVNAQVLSGDAYFASARLARSKARDEAIATISTVLDDETLTEDDKKEASAKAMSITDAIEAESRIENLINCLLYTSRCV